MKNKFIFLFISLVSFLFISLVISNMIYGNIITIEKNDNKDSTTEFINITQGGLGGRIIKVTNTNSYGEGSLRAAIESQGPRIVVFEVGGIIDLDMQCISINNPYITVAGQTAPFPGITIIKGGIVVRTHDVIIRHISVRPGDAGQASLWGDYRPDGMGTSSGYNVIIDHCSITWGVDENLSASGPRLLGPRHTSHNVTFSNNIIAEGLRNHQGSLIHDNCQYIAIIGNLYAHNAYRNPYFKANTTGVIVNNLIYNPGSFAIQLGWSTREFEGTGLRPRNPQISVVGNVMYWGRDTRNDVGLVGGYLEGGDAFIEDNIAYDDNLQESSLVGENIILLNKRPVWMKGLNPISSEKVVNSIINNVGARPKERDPIDQRIIQDFIEKTGRIIDSQVEVGGYPDYETTYRKLDIPADKEIGKWLDEMAKALE